MVKWDLAAFILVVNLYLLSCCFGMSANFDVLGGVYFLSTPNSIYVVYPWAPRVAPRNIDKVQICFSCKRRYSVRFVSKYLCVLC